MNAVSHNLNDYFQDLTNTKSADECMAMIKRHVEPLGFRNIVFGDTRRPSPANKELPSYLRFSLISPECEQRYREMQYQNECPIYRASLKPGTLPLIWQNIWERVGTNAVQRQMRDEAGELGVSQGVSVPFKELSDDRGAIGFSTDLCATEARQAIDTHMPQLFLMAHYLHAVLLERYVDKSYFENVHPLTAGQLKCLF